MNGAATTSRFGNGSPATPLPLAVISIGNELMGDDGLGHVVRRLICSGLAELEVPIPHLGIDGDLYQVQEWLNSARHFIFIDALAGDPVGEIACLRGGPASHAPSFHQLDIGAVMTQLEILRVVEPFPSWEIWGIRIRPPRHFGEGLSPVVLSAVPHLVERLSARIRALVVADKDNDEPGGQKEGGSPNHRAGKTGVPGQT